MLNSLVPIALLTTVGFLPAQRQWRVDANNAPGTDFLSIAAAVTSSSVQAGDVLRVATGRYGPFTTAKGVAIVTDGPVTLFENAARAAITIEGLPQGQTFRIQGTQIEHSCTNARSAVIARNNAGTVVFDRVETRGTGYPTWMQPSCPSVSLTRCALVFWNRGQILSGGGITATDTTLVLNTVRSDGLRGSDLVIRRIPSTPGLTLRRGVAYLANVQLNGGRGSGNVLGSPGVSTFLANGPTRIEFAGGPNSSSANAGSGGSVPALLLDAQTTVLADPSAVLSGTGGGGASTGGTFQRQALGVVLASGAAPGGTATVQLLSPPRLPIFVAISNLTAGTSSPLGTVFLDLPNLVTVVAGTQSASGSLTRTLAVPASNALRGGILGVQAAIAYTTPPGVRLTNPAALMIR